MSETKEAATCRKIPLTVNCGNLSPVYADAPETVIRRKNDLPVLVLGETVVFCLTFLDGNGDEMVFQSGDTFELSADVDYDRSADDPLMLYSGNDMVNLADDWADADPASGRISIRVNCNTEGFVQKLNDADSVGVRLEVRRFSADSTMQSALLSTTATALNTVRFDGIPTAVELSSYYTSDQTDAVFARKTDLAETRNDLDTVRADYMTESGTVDLIDTALIPYAKEDDVATAIGAALETLLLSYSTKNEIAAAYLPFTGGNITGRLTVGGNPVTALPVGTVAGTLYVGASREFTTIAAALNHIRQSSNGLDKVWNILLDPGEHALSGTITGLNLSFAPVSGSYSTGCSIISSGVVMEGCRATFSKLHFKVTAGASTVLTARILSYIHAADCVFDCTANTNPSLNACYVTYVSFGNLTRCTFYPGSGSSQSYARARNLSYLGISGISFIGTGAGIAVRAGYSSVVELAGTASTVSDMFRAALAENGSFIFTGGGTMLTATNVTTYATPALNTIGNNQSFIN